METNHLVEIQNNKLKDKLIMKLIDIGYVKVSDGRQLYELNLLELSRLLNDARDRNGKNGS